MNMTQQGATRDAPGARAWAAGPLEAPIGWFLVIGGVCTAIVWTTLLGVPMLLDVRDLTEAAEISRRLGALQALLPLLAVSSVLLGLGLLRGGRSSLDPRVITLVYGVPALGALAAGLWLVAAASAAALVVLLLLRRVPWNF
jgi:hypothetical protein